MQISFGTTLNCMFIFYNLLLTSNKNVYILTALYVAVRILKYANMPLKYSIKPSYFIILNIYLSYLNVTFWKKLKFTNLDSFAK